MSELGYFPCLVLGLPPLWLLWYVSLVPVTRLASSHADRALLYLAPLLCLALMPLCLLGRGWAAQAGPGAVLLCCANGMTCVLLASWVFPLLGLSARDDVAERRNRPA